MLRGGSKAQLFVFLLFFGQSLLSAPLTPQEENQMLHASWKLPSQFTLERVETLLNQFSRETFQKAFRFIGVEQDFFHGHLLFERILVNGQPVLNPRAILYHTQEEAHKAHWEKSVDSKYDYLNVTTRNWIQWLSDDPAQDGLKIENARDYLDVNQKKPSQFFDEHLEPQKDLHYTIHAKNLDSNKLGFELAGELQFEFYSGENSPYGEDRQIEVNLSEQEISLKLFTNTYFIERRPNKL